MLATLLVQYNPDGSLVYTNPYQITQQLFGRQPFSFVEIDLDFCANTFGVAPCTATGSGDAKCYNTYASCQDTANFANTVKTYRYCSPNGARIPNGLDAIPCLKSISVTPAQIDAGKGLGLRAVCSITLQDFPHSDIRTDPYLSDRTYIPINRGTYFGKLKARNPFYNGRIMRIYNGYLNDDGSFDAANFEVRTYVLDSWDSVDANGITKITGKDILKLASDERAVCPKASVGKITLDMTAIATTCTLTPTGVGALDYPASGYVRIGSEVMSFTRSGDVLTVVRGRKGTTATTHKQSDTVQLCKEIVGQTAQNIVYDLLVNYAGVDASFINISDWNAEQVAYLPRLYSTLITSPTGISKILAELTEQIGFFLFWDEVSSQIKFQTIRPNSPSETVHELTSEFNLLADSLRMRDITDDRVNETWVYYGIIDPTKNLSEESNYSNLYVASNVGDQSTNQNRDVRIKKLLSRWIDDGAAAIELGQRYLDRYALAPVEADFALDAKDANIKLCDFVQVESNQYQDFSGSPLAILLQVTKRIEKQTGTTWAFTARQFAFSSDLNPVRRIEIDGSNRAELFNLDLKAAHDARFAPAVAGTQILFIIKSGILVSSANTSTYALTNPSTWAAGVLITLEVESGAIVAGRGGDGGRGGVAFSDPIPLAHSYRRYYSDGFDGGKGGNGIRNQYPLTLKNAGKISVGGGGGGASAGAISAIGAHFDTSLNISGNGGGGGWPHGSAGQLGRMIYADNVFADYVNGYTYAGFTHDERHYAGNIGETGGDITDTSVALGGNVRSIDNSVPYFTWFVETYSAGYGASPILGTTSTGGGGSSAAGSYILYGNGGNGGNNGDYAINGISLITVVASGGTIYGGTA